MQFLAFVGVSGAGLAALAVADEKLRHELGWAFYFLSISFLFFVCALQYVAYLSRQWEVQFVDALSDVGMLSLFAGVVAILKAGNAAVAPYVAMLAGGVWLLNYALRIRMDWSYLKTLHA